MLTFGYFDKVGEVLALPAFFDVVGCQSELGMDRRPVGLMAASRSALLLALPKKEEIRFGSYP